MFKIGDKIIGSKTVDERIYIVKEFSRRKILDINSERTIILQFNDGEDNTSISEYDLKRLIDSDRYKIFNG